MMQAALLSAEPPLFMRAHVNKVRKSGARNTRCTTNRGRPDGSSLNQIIIQRDVTFAYVAAPIAEAGLHAGAGRKNTASTSVNPLRASRRLLD